MTIKSFTTSSVDYGRWIKLLVVGPPGVGKTLMSSTFPDTYFACSEPGLMSIADRNIRGTRMTSSEEIWEVIQTLRKPPELRGKVLGVRGPVNTVVVDTIDEMQQILIGERKKDQNVDALRLQDYGWLGEQTKEILRQFRNLDMHVVFTCHSKKTQDNAKDTLIYEPGLVGAASEWVPGAVDLALMLSANSRPVLIDEKMQTVTERELQTYHDAQHPWVKDRSGKLPTKVPVNFTDDYKRLNKFIFGDISTVAEELAVAVEELADDDSPVVGTLATPDPEYAAVLPAPDASEFTCTECGKGVPEAQASLAKLRFRTVLCEEHFQDHVTELAQMKEKANNG